MTHSTQNSHAPAIDPTTDPLFVGVDVDAILDQMETETMRTASARRAGGRRCTSSHSPLVGDPAVLFMLGAEAAPRLHAAHVA